MSANFTARFFHDLRAPLARALTFSKLLEEARPNEAAELLVSLQKSLEDLDQLLQNAEASLGVS